MGNTEERILDAALDVLGRSPEASMSEIASAAGVVRRTVYAYFPTRRDLVRALAQRAALHIATVLVDAESTTSDPAATWVQYVLRLWPVTHRYRVLLALRRGEYGDEIHALLKPVDEAVTELVRRGQNEHAFGKHLPPRVLSQVAQASVFAIADSDLRDETLDAHAAAVTSLLILGVPRTIADTLALQQPS